MGLKRAFVIGLCLAAVAAVVMLAAVIIRPPKIYISEICPSNSETSKKTAMQDKNGEPSDWIEIYNPTNKDISLTGFSLSKNGGGDQPLGGYVIKAHDYIIVYCSSAGFENADFPHADFSIGKVSEAEIILKYDSFQCESIKMPKLNKGVSYSKNVKGEMYVSEPTPLAANAEKTIGDTPVFSQAAGSYEKAFDLEITAGESQTVYYTTDGTDPATSDTRKVYENALRIDDRSDDENVLSAYDPMKIQLDYRDSIKLPDKSAVDKGTVVRACAEGTSGKCGKTVTATYFVDVSSADHNDLPIVSITTDPDGLFNEKTGIYCLGDVYKEYDEENSDHPWNGSIPANYNQRGREWEKECYVEYFDSEGNSLISQDFYNKTIDSLDLNLISCVCGHSGCLIRHGSYKRSIQLADRILSLFVVRVYCKICGHTHALLLSSMVPYSQIPLALHVRLIQLLQQNPEQFRLGRVERVKGTIVSKEYFFPKRFVTIRSRDIKRELTEEQRKEIAERLKKLS